MTKLVVENVYKITGRGYVVTATLESGEITTGDTVHTNEHEVKVIGVDLSKPNPRKSYGLVLGNIELPSSIKAGAALTGGPLPKTKRRRWADRPESRQKRAARHKFIDDIEYFVFAMLPAGIICGLYVFAILGNATAGWVLLGLMGIAVAIAIPYGIFQLVKYLKWFLADKGD